MPNMGPQPGQTYRNKHSGKIGVLVSFETRRHAWMTMRFGDREQEYPLDWLDKHWVPCDPRGKVL